MGETPSLKVGVYHAEDKHKKGLLSGLWAKPRVFHQKPSLVGLTGLYRVFMGLWVKLWKTQIPFVNSELENQILKINR